MIFCPPDSLWLRRWGRRRSPAGTISPAGSAPWGGECLWSRLSHACFGSNLQLWRKYGWKKRLFFLKPELADKFCRISLRYFWILWSLKLVGKRWEPTYFPTMQRNYERYMRKIWWSLVTYLSWLKGQEGPWLWLTGHRPFTVSVSAVTTMSLKIWKYYNPLLLGWTCADPVLW